MADALTVSPAILVVDDVEGSRFVFANWLRRAGYDVHEAANGAEAIEALARFRFDLAVLDVHLPDMTGFELCDHIKSSRATASIPVLHVSATATDPSDRSAGLDRGADAYLVEPIEREELLSTVAALLRYHEARRTSERLAARLEQLHQTTLLLNAAATLNELIGFAVIGATAIFGTPAVLVAARENTGWVAFAAPNDLEPTIAPCPPEAVLDVARSANVGAVVDLAPVGERVRQEGVTKAVSLTTPRGELVGAVLLFDDEAEDIDLMLDHFAQALAVAIENQRVYDIEHQIALTLQHAMLPQTIATPPGLEVDVRYLAASDTVEVGGDFYEVAVLDKHRTLFAIGDVVGHSLIAATVMAELRYSLRAFALLGLQAEEIVSRLNEMLLDSHPHFSATLCIVVVDTESGTAEVTNAGHIPPLLCVGSEHRFIEDHGPLLGLRDPPSTPTVSVAFELDARLLLITDGLVERRSESLDLGLERLATVVAQFEGPLHQQSDLLLREFSAHQSSIDDMAIVAIRRVPSA